MQYIRWHVIIIVISVMAQIESDNNAKKDIALFFARIIAHHMLRLPSYYLHVYREFFANQWCQR